MLGLCLVFAPLTGLLVCVVTRIGSSLFTSDNKLLPLPNSFPNNDNIAEGSALSLVHMNEYFA